MNLKFDEVEDRRSTDSLKWGYYPPDILPLWVADMDFPAPVPVIEALHRRVRHGIFGYGLDLPGLKETVAERLSDGHHWKVDTEQIMLLPGLVSGLNIVCRAIGEPGDGVIVNTPVYPPFLKAPGNQGRQLQYAELAAERQSNKIHYEIDFQALQDAVTDRTRLFILCNPHNPVGRVFTKDELERLADLCIRHDLVICADEIHCDLLLGDSRHVSLATLDSEISQRSITLIAPSKTFNVPGLGCSFAVVPNPTLRRRVRTAMRGIVPDVNLLGMHAALAAYTECQEWLDSLLAYLTENRKYLGDFIDQKMPGISSTFPEATYLAWLDCRELPIEANPHHYFLEQARVALNDGQNFGAGGAGFTRLNFGCPRTTLTEALERMRSALEKA